MAIDLTDPIFTDEDKAREHLEAIRWPDGPVCTHCGPMDKVYRLQGKSHRPSLFHCNNCNGAFTVTTGSVMESSHVPLNKWVLTFRLMASSKKGMSAHQLHRSIGVTYKTAWFMFHRIREAMRPAFEPTMRGDGGTVEMDTTYVGGKEKNRHANKRQNLGRGGAGKEPVVALVERGGKVTSHHMPHVTAKNVGAVLDKQLHDDATLYTDDDRTFRTVKPRHRPDGIVRHSTGEYVRGEVHTNPIEGYFSILKRGINGSITTSARST
jgi:transposase-like protein